MSDYMTQFNSFASKIGNHIQDFYGGTVKAIYNDKISPYLRDKTSITIVVSGKDVTISTWSKIEETIIKTADVGKTFFLSTKGQIAVSFLTLVSYCYSPIVVPSFALFGGVLGYSLSRKEYERRHAEFASGVAFSIPKVSDKQIDYARIAIHATLLACQLYFPFMNSSFAGINGFIIGYGMGKEWLKNGDFIRDTIEDRLPPIDKNGNNGLNGGLIAPHKDQKFLDLIENI